MMLYISCFLVCVLSTIYAQEDDKSILQRKEMFEYEDVDLIEIKKSR